MLEDKDTSAAYKYLQELEKISDETGSIYAYTKKFVNMIGSDKYVVWVRGFRLFGKPTAVRQALAALADIIRYKPIV